MYCRNVLQKVLRIFSAVVFACAFFVGATNASFAACTADQIDVAGDGTNCEEAKFSVTTTSDTSNFIFSMSAAGTFYVDWGDGNVETIDRTDDVTSEEYSHTYSSSGKYTIKFGGLATGYSSASNTADISFYKKSGGTQSKIASISGSLSALFPQTGNNNDNYKFYQTFSDCTNLTEIPAGLFSGITTGASYMFSRTFYGCTSLTEIPVDLFSNITTGAWYMFYGTFSGCASLKQIPAGLFSNITTGADYMFYSTFSYCASLEQIPAGLFSGITTGAKYMFSLTFSYCTSLEQIPAELFSNITTGAESMFQETFSYCRKLMEIPAGLFSNITTGADDMFRSTFSYCRKLMEIPAGLFSGITTGARFMFRNTFDGCTSLEQIPAGLFSGITTGAVGMFYQTFNGCTSLKQIPAGLFSNITTGASSMFSGTFSGCTSLEQIPAGLFSNITTGASSMFNSTFSGCTNLTGYIPPTTFAGLIANNHPTAENMWKNTFTNTNLATSCPAGTMPYTTGYESEWDGKVSCQESSCASNEIDVAGDGTNCQTAKFSVTTTNDTSNFIFTMSAAGTFYVDCGDGGTLSGTDASGNTITRNDTSVTEYTCSFSSGTHTIKFGGTATGYSTSQAAISFYKDTGGTQSKISSISGSLSALFPQFDYDSGKYPRFDQTFRGAAKIDEIPNTLFSGLAGGNSMFRQTFFGCSHITSIPSDLFASIHTGTQYMFTNTFAYCTRLTRIPKDLFAGITNEAKGMFLSTFQGCSTLTDFIPPSTFAGLVAAGHPSAEDMWKNTFSGTALDTSCSGETVQYITGYESEWGGPVSCEPCTMYSGACHAMCSGMSTLHAGEYTYPVFADKTNVPSPVLHVKENGTTCYVYFEPDTGGEHGLKVRWNDAVYRAIDPR